MLSKLTAIALEHSATLIAVSKTKPNEQLMELYHLGQRDFGENYVQELEGKAASLPKDIRWHFIGHLQSNKVKYIAPFVHLIHAVDSVSLLKEIDKQAKKNQRTIAVLLQLKINDEQTKFGFDAVEINELLADWETLALTNIHIIGVMGMATFTNNLVQVREEFQTLASVFSQVKNTYFADKEHFKEISMGMSDDYPIALEEGATMLRIGSLLFGKR